MKDLKDLFIPYELAVMAKEKGFNEPVLGWYKQRFTTWVLELGHDEPDRGLPLPAPLYQQIVDWFKEKHGIRICENYYQSNDTWGWGIYDERKRLYWYPTINKAIEEAFKLI